VVHTIASENPSDNALGIAVFVRGENGLTFEMIFLALLLCFLLLIFYSANGDLFASEGDILVLSLSRIKPIKNLRCGPKVLYILRIACVLLIYSRDCSGSSHYHTFINVSRSALTR
jgi:hypothetical protein